VATGRGDERPGTEASNGYAGDQASPIRKPLDEDRNRDDVPEAEPDAAHQPIADIQPPQAMAGEAGEKDAHSV